MSDINFMPGIIHIVISIITVIAGLLLKGRSKYEEQELYDKCEPNDFKYRYFIRLVFNPSKKYHFSFKRNLITVRIHDKKGVYLATFNIRFSTLTAINDLNQETEQEINLVIYRKEMIPEWGHLTVYTEEKGALYVYSIRIISIDTNEEFLIPINGMVRGSLPTTQYNEQLFKCVPQILAKDNEVGRPEKRIEVMELIFIAFWALNLDSFIIAVLNFFLNESSFLKQNFLIASILTSILVFTIEFILLLFYRMVIKRYYWKSYGSNFWVIVSNIFLTLCILFGLGLGIGSIILLLFANPSVNLYLSISISFLIVLNVLFVMISHFIKCQIFTKVKVSQDFLKRSKLKKMPSKSSSVLSSTTE